MYNPKCYNVLQKFITVPFLQWKAYLQILPRLYLLILHLVQVKQIQNSHKDFQISAKTFPLTYTHFEEWMSLQPILKTLSSEFSLQIHSELTMTPINALQYIMGTSIHASSFFHTLLQYLQNTFFPIIIIYFMLWYWLLNISLE
jgi:hypothetical protein